jgi:chemotaxis response regulator CheB
MNPAMKVAVIEYEAIIALDLKEILHSMKIDNIFVFRNFTGLFDLLKADKPNLIIIDYPDNNISQKIRLLTEGFGIPVIFLSELPDEKEFSAIPNCSCLKKPYVKKDLIKMVKGKYTMDEMAEGIE